jgi:hypothetical protein
LGLLELAKNATCKFLLQRYIIFSNSNESPLLNYRFILELQNNSTNIFKRNKKNRFHMKSETGKDPIYEHQLKSLTIKTSLRTSRSYITLYNEKKSFNKESRPKDRSAC